MPEYLAPGVYIEETSFRAKSIEGVSTTTTGFVGPTRYGPTDLEPELVTSVVEFVRIYGDGEQLEFDGLPKMHNYMWHAVRAFFEEGGKRLYISRAFGAIGKTNDGRATGALETGGGTPPMKLKARFPGKSGDMKVRLTLKLGQNLLSTEMVKQASGGLVPRVAISRSLRHGDIVHVRDLTEPISSPPGSGGFYRAVERRNTITEEVTWEFHDLNGGILRQADLGAVASPPSVDSVRVVTLDVTTRQADGGGTPGFWGDLALDQEHKVGGAYDSFSKRFVKHPENGNDARNLPFFAEIDSTLDNGLKLLVNGLLKATRTGAPDLTTALLNGNSSAADRSIDIDLTKGNDGKRPEAADYEGAYDEATKQSTGLRAFEDLEDISIVAAPGSTYNGGGGYSSDAAAITGLLISHATKMRYRIAVVDCHDSQGISAVRATRARLDSNYAAFYYPWIKILDPITRQEINLPPSGFVCGIYARNDVNRAVYKAPANEVVNLAIGFEALINRSQQEALNPEGINCFRFFEGRGFRLWGARTMSSDPEWKYVNLRRYFAYLERSIDKGTQWAVFEPNGEKLWANVRQTIEDFLLNEWQMGALLGEKPDKAFFVKCDRSTMTQNDLDNGRLVCLIGVCPLRPAEFVIFRIGQWTSDRKI